MLRASALGFVSASPGSRAGCEYVSSASQRARDGTWAPW